jgi:hypothetical protein
MRRFLWLAGIFLVMAMPAKGQQLTPQYEFSGGYDYTLFPNSEGKPHLNMSGWDVQGVYNWRRHFAAALDVSGLYNTQSSSNPGINGITTHVYSFAVGPRIYPFGHHKLTPYGQFLFGDGHISQFLPGVPPFPPTTVKDTSFTVVAGGGVDINWTEHWAIKLVEVDYAHSNFFSTRSSGVGQGEERIVVGVVYRFGVAGVRGKK